MKFQLLTLSLLTSLTLTLASPEPKKHKATPTTTSCTGYCSHFLSASPGTDCAKITPLPTVGQTYCLDATYYVECQEGFGHQMAEEVMYGDMCWTGSSKVAKGPGKITAADWVLPGQTGQEKGYTPPPSARRMV